MHPSGRLGPFEVDDYPRPPGDRGTLSDRGTRRIQSSPRSHRTALLIACAVLVAVSAHNAATYESVEPRIANATHATIEYGWPVTCYVGDISVEAMCYSTGPRQHWAATSGGTLSSLGLITDIGLALVLSIGTYRALAWAFAAFNAKLTIATLLGMFVYLGCLFAFEAADNVRFFDISPMTTELLIESHIFEYTEKIVWMSLFVTCLWLPNAASRRFVARRGG